VSPAVESIRVQLRRRDMDALGHLNQSVYHELLEEARAAVMMSVMRPITRGDSIEGFVLAHVDLDYHVEVRKDHGEVEVLGRIAGFGKSSIRIEHEIRLPDGTLAASGKTVLVGWDRAKRTKRVLSDAERLALSDGSDG
jgi:acyl-CoA thioester hydrolase